MKIATELTPPLAAISGGLGDIGAAIARCLAGAGADVSVADLATEDRAATLREEIEGQGRGFYYGSLDVTDPAAVEAWHGEVATRFGRGPNLLIANAAIVTLKRFPDLSPAEWAREIDVNLNGGYYFARTGIDGLVREQRAGRVVFLGSWAAHAPHRNLPAYSVAKAGLRMLTQTLALEYAGQGILVNELAPGYVDAGLSAQVFAREPSLRESAAQQVPVGKLITAEEVAAQVLYLCSDLANHVTGTTLLQDGGLSLRSPAA